MVAATALGKLPFYGSNIHGPSKTIVFRSTSDLSVVWKHRAEDGFVAAVNGDYVALRIARDPDDQPLQKPYISVYDRKADGEIARLQIPEPDIRALSSDGKLLAVVVPEQAQRVRGCLAQESVSIRVNPWLKLRFSAAC